MNEEREDRLDQLLDLLADEMAERLEARSRVDRAPSDQAPSTDVEPDSQEAPADLCRPGPAEPVSPREPEPGPAADVEPEGEEPEPEATPEPPSAPPVPSHTARLLGRLALGLLALVVVINIPINRHGRTLATAMPDRRALVIRQGLVVKEADEPEIYVYEDGQFRWITSLKAFEMRGYAWEDVHVVEHGFLEPYQIGPPIHVILKCPDSPHIYQLEGEEKLWIVDIEAFEAEGFVWEDVEFVSCEYLRSLPDGETIPPGHGPPPQP